MKTAYNNIDIRKERLYYSSLGPGHDVNAAPAFFIPNFLLAWVIPICYMRRQVIRQTEIMSRRQTLYYLAYLEGALKLLNEIKTGACVHQKSNIQQTLLFIRKIIQHKRGENLTAREIQAIRMDGERACRLYEQTTRDE
jgi:hypothetical protein